MEWGGGGQRHRPGPLFRKGGTDFRSGGSTSRPSQLPAPGCQSALCPPYLGIQKPHCLRGPGSLRLAHGGTSAVDLHGPPVANRRLSGTRWTCHPLARLSSPVPVNPPPPPPHEFTCPHLSSDLPSPTHPCLHPPIRPSFLPSVYYPSSICVSTHPSVRHPSIHLPLAHPPLHPFIYHSSHHTL